MMRVRVWVLCAIGFFGVAWPSQVLAKPAVAASPAEFTDELARLAEIAACSQPIDSARPLPAADVRVVTRHCAVMEATRAHYRARWVEKAVPFFRQLVPADVPRTVLYPFAGGDLATALAVFPDATEITTLSLEPAGDPRGVLVLHGSALAAALAVVARELRFLYVINFSNTRNMIGAMRKGRLPTQLVFSLSALALHGYQPIGLRYFALAPTGELRYLDEASVAALPAAEGPGGKLRVDSRAFANVEVTFRPRGGGPARIYRHIQANLDDAHLAQQPALVAHLRGKGRVAVMTKAASYLLGFNSFGQIRGLLLDQADWMVSDATGIPPTYGHARGFAYQTFGRFAGAHMRGGARAAKAWRALWQAQPRRPLPMRFGYPDRAMNHHLVVMARARDGGPR